MAGTNTTGYTSQLFSGLLAARGINSPTINAGIQSAIAGQNQANKANQQRYDQGLQTLQGGSDKASGLLQSATNQIQNNGQAQANRINLQEQQGLGNATQSAVSRGLTDTTISDAMQRGVSRDANDARLANQEQINRQQAQAKDAQAAQASQGAGAISNWIGARNDEGPNMGLLANLVTGAASDPRTQRTGTVQRNSVPGLGGAAGSNGLPSNFGQPQSSNNGYSMSAAGAVPYGQQASGANFASSQAAGPLSSALSPQGSMSITNSIAPQQAPAAPAPMDSGYQPVTSPWDQQFAEQDKGASAKADDGSVYVSNPYGKFTKTEWDALSEEQQKNVAAGRQKDRGPGQQNGGVNIDPNNIKPQARPLSETF